MDLVLKLSILFRLVRSLLSKSLASKLNFSMFFDRFASFSQFIWSLSLGLLLDLKYSSRFPVVCSLFSNCLVVVEPSAPCSHTLQSLSLGLLLVLELSSLLRAFCSLFSNTQTSFERLINPLFSNSPIFFERFAPFLLFLNFPSRLLLVPDSLISFAWFALCSQHPPVLFERFAPASPILSLFGAVSSLSSNFLTSLEQIRLCSQIRSFERLAPCSQIPESFSSGWLPAPQSLSSGLPLVLKFSSLFRMVCPLFSNPLVSFERFDLCSQKL